MTKTARNTIKSPVPVIFIAGSDPVLDGLVPSLAHPSGNLTGFYVFEPSLGAKLLELLKEIAPRVNRVAIVSNPDTNPVNWSASAATAGFEVCAPRSSRSSARLPTGCGFDVLGITQRSRDHFNRAMSA